MKIVAEITDDFRKCNSKFISFPLRQTCTVHSTSGRYIIIYLTLIYWEVFYERSTTSPRNI